MIFCYRLRIMRRSTSNYSLEEVTVLVEEYAELRDKRHKTSILIRLVDIQRAFRRLSKPYREAVLLCGMVGLTTRTAGVLAGVSKDTMNRRYHRGLREIVTILNGGKS